MGRIVSFAVPGRPSRWQRPTQVVRRGKVIRITVPEAEAGKRRIAQYARIAWKGPPVCGPVSIKIDCIFAIPVSWPKAVQQAAREGRVFHIQDPDYDQLCKQLLDSLKSIVYIDDNQVVGFPQGCKRYGGPERTEITIHVIDQQSDEITPGQRAVEKRAIEQGLLPKQSPSRLAPPQLFPPKTEKDSGS